MSEGGPLRRAFRPPLDKVWNKFENRGRSKFEFTFSRAPKFEFTPAGPKSFKTVRRRLQSLNKFENSLNIV